MITQLKEDLVVLFLQRFRKKIMEKFVISEFGVCHKCSDKIRRDFLKQAEIFSYTHNVSCGGFAVFGGNLKRTLI